MSGYGSRTMYRFKQRRISLLDSPSVVRRKTYALVRASLRMRTIAVVHNASFAAGRVRRQLSWPPGVNYRGRW